MKPSTIISALVKATFHVGYEEHTVDMLTDLGLTDTDPFLSEVKRLRRKRLRQAAKFKQWLLDNCIFYFANNGEVLNSDTYKRRREKLVRELLGLIAPDGRDIAFLVLKSGDVVREIAMEELSYTVRIPGPEFPIIDLVGDGTFDRQPRQPTIGLNGTITKMLWRISVTEEEDEHTIIQ